MRAVDRLYEPSRFLSRLYRHILAMRPTRRQTRLQQGEQSKFPGRNLSYPCATELRDLLGLVKFCLAHGVVADYRGQFWRQLLGIYRQNPSRLKKYLINCIIGEIIFWVRREVLRLAAAASGALGVKNLHT